MTTSRGYSFTIYSISDHCGEPFDRIKELKPVDGDLELVVLEQDVHLGHHRLEGVAQLGVCHGLDVGVELGSNPGQFQVMIKLLSTRET